MLLLVGIHDCVRQFGELAKTSHGFLAHLKPFRKIPALFSKFVSNLFHFSRSFALSSRTCRFGPRRLKKMPSCRKYSFCHGIDSGRWHSTDTTSFHKETNISLWRSLTYCFSSKKKFFFIY